MRIYVNTSAPDPARARTVGLTQLTPLPFPVLMVGTVPALDFIFADRGSVESYSGNANYSLRVTVADAWQGPAQGNWAATVGSDDLTDLRADLNAAGLQSALNNTNTVSGEGGVMVTEQLPGQFLIAHNNVGSVAGITVDTARLVPDVTAELQVLTTGDDTTRQLVQLYLRRNPPAQTNSWTTITSPSNGWTGSVDLTSNSAYELMQMAGERRGAFIELDTLITAEVRNLSNATVFTYQSPVTLRALNYNVPTSSNVSTQNFFARPNVTGLASNVADQTKLGGLSTSGGQFPVGSTVQCLFSSDVVAQFIRKASTANQSVPFVVRPYDYDAANNAYQWILDRVSKQSVPCTWDADLSAWVYMVGYGNANAVGLAADQTGFSLPS